jgi:hypothetical protein
MSGALIGGVIGGVIGFAFGNPQIGWMIGSTLGGLVDGRKNHGPELNDLRPQASEYGRPIPIVYSIMAVGGNVIWASDLVKTSDGDGGKGGGSGTGPTYAANFAILICEGSGDKQLGRIWAGPEKRLVFDPSTQKLESGSMRFYDGAEDQLPDPLMESHLGAGNVPAYRGYAYIVIENFDVSKSDGNRIPFLTIEVGQKDTSTPGSTAPENLGVAFFDKMMDGGSYFITTYNGSYYGVLKHRKSDMVLMHNRLLGGWEPTQYLFYDVALDTVVQAAPGDPRAPTPRW